MASVSSVGLKAKKRRTEQDDRSQPQASTPLTYQRPAELWMADGNIVLQVETTQFRVHRSILGLNSKFFTSVFNLPDPENAPTAEGCRILHVMGDTQDWKNMLMLIYHPFSSVLQMQKPCPFALLASMFGLSKKYHFNLIRNDALEQFKLLIPTDLGLWDARFNPLAILPEVQPSGYPWMRNQEFYLINTALRLGIQSILPALYYLCAVNMEVDCIFKGQTRPDGTISRLSLDSQHIILVGRSKILDLIPDYTLAWVFSPTVPLKDCKSRKQCTLTRTSATGLQVKVARNLNRNLRCALNLYKPSDGRKPDYCLSCQAHIEKMHEEGRQKLWKELPLVFGLPKWEDLKDFVD